MLRARVGQEFDIVVGPAVRRGQIVSLTDGRVDFDLGEEVPTVSAPNLTLLMAIFKFDRMEWAIEKCTELGVNEIVQSLPAGQKFIWLQHPPNEWNAG